ncbi:MAG TPA: RNA polymerase sigma-70 factor [Chitinophaga sp.]
MISTYSERELLQRSGNGDKMAFAEIFRRYKLKLYGFVFRLTHSPEMAEDVVQNVFLKLWQDRHLLDNIDHLSSYIFRMAQNQTINAFKRSAKETLVIRQLFTGEPAAPFDPETDLAYKEMEQAFRRAVDQLPAQQKKVYLLSREEGLKHEEIARRLGISAGTVKNHMIQLLRTLRKVLDNNPPSSAGIGLFLLIVSAFEK